MISIYDYVHNPYVLGKLEEAGITDMVKLLSMSEAELLMSTSFGYKSLKMLNKELGDFGLYIGVPEISQ